MLCLDGSGYFSRYGGAEVLVFAQRQRQGMN
jgi:hypothetical protein